MTTSERLSNRKKQPGDDQTYKTSEGRLVDALGEWCSVNPKFEVLVQPRLYTSYSADDGFTKFDAGIRHVDTFAVMLFDAKKQNDAGNAHERVYRYFTPKFADKMKLATIADYMPCCAVMCESLSVNSRYIDEFTDHLYEDDFLLWVDYDTETMFWFLDRISKRTKNAETSSLACATRYRNVVPQGSQRPTPMTLEFIL